MDIIRMEKKKEQSNLLFFTSVQVRKRNAERMSAFTF